MANPAKVLAFLDVAGSWDASLALVMVGGIAVTWFAVRWARRRGRPLLTSTFHLPHTSRIDARLVAGSVVFGVGWGLSGYCPGPAVMSLAGGRIGAVVYLASMVVGMAVYEAMFGSRRQPTVEHRGIARGLSQRAPVQRSRSQRAGFSTRRCST